MLLFLILRDRFIHRNDKINDNTSNNDKQNKPQMVKSMSKHDSWKRYDSNNNEENKGLLPENENNNKKNNSNITIAQQQQQQQQQQLQQQQFNIRTHGYSIESSFIHPSLIPTPQLVC